MRPRRCSTTAHRSCRCSRPAARESRASWSARARRAEEMERILTIAARTPDHGKLDAVALRHRRRRPARRLRGPAPASAGRRRIRTRHRRKRQKEEEFAHYAGKLVVLISAPRRGPQDPALGAAIVVRRGGHEPAARSARAGLCRRLGDRLARLFRARPRRLLRAGRADRRLHLHRPCRARARGAARGPIWPTCGSRGSRQIFDVRLELCAIRCITTA